MIERDHPCLSVCRQAELVGLSRSTVYYQPRSRPEDLELMRRIDEQYTRTPFYGSRRMTHALRAQGHRVNRKRVQRLLRQMGLEAVYAQPHLSQAAPGQTIYPYLLRNVEITRTQQVWSADITYVHLRQGWVYVVVVMDWFSRYVLAYEVSTSLDSGFCQSALRQALQQGKPEIFNTDQGVQFTAAEFTSILKEQGIRISMDGRGRALDNVFTERLWRSLKYEEVYLHEYVSVQEARQGIFAYFTFYNRHRPHQTLNYSTPESVHFSLNQATQVAA